MTWLWSSKRTVSCFFKTWLLAEDDASRIAWCIFRLAWVLNKWSVNAMYRKILGDNWNDPFSKRKGRLFFNQQVRCRQSLLRPIREKVPPLHMHARVLLESGFWSFVVVYVKGLLSHTTNKKKTEHVWILMLCGGLCKRIAKPYHQQKTEHICWVNKVSSLFFVLTDIPQ